MLSILDQYLADLQHRPNRLGRAVSPATVRAARADLQGFIAWWEQTHRLSFDLTLVLDRELRQWQLHRQREDGAKPSTINRANASLRAFFAWAQREKLITHNPATDLHDLPLHEIAPRSVPPPALDWLLRAIAAQDATTRLRDLALLALLSDCGLRAQEAADVQLRDLDLDGAMLTVRSGKGRNARRVPLTAAVVRTFRDYLKLRCPNGQPRIGSEAEREPLLMKRNIAKAGQPWEPGLTPNAMRKHLTELGRAAAERIQAQAAKESSLERIAELEALARQVAAISPHPLRHGLAYRMWKTASPAHIQTILGHSRVATTVLFTHIDSVTVFNHRVHADGCFPEDTSPVRATMWVLHRSADVSKQYNDLEVWQTDRGRFAGGVGGGGAGQVKDERVDEIVLG